MAGSETMKHIVKQSLETTSEPWIIPGALKMKDSTICSIFDKLQALLKEQKSYGPVVVEFDGIISDELLQYASQQAGEMSCSHQPDNRRRLASAFDVFASESVKRELSKLKVNGNVPVSIEEWIHALKNLRIKKCQDEIQAELQTLGCQGTHDVVENGIIRNELAQSLEALSKLKSLLKVLPEHDRDKLQAIVASIGDNQALQAQRRQLAMEIEALESSLVEAQVLFQISQTFSHDDLRSLNQLTQIVGRLKKCDSSKSSERSSRRHDGFVQAFKTSIRFHRFLVMTTDQVNELVPADHTFGLTILDEASQSTCTALTILARSQRLLVIGDDKQSSPSENQWSEESINGLNASLPDIPAAQQLSAGYGFFDFCRVAFPNHYAFLPDHFRCHPEAIAWSNETSYHGRMNTYKPPGRESALVGIRVNGRRDRKKKTNQVEGDTIAQHIYELIKTTAESRLPVQSIGVISMGGPDQCKLIESCLDKKLDPLRVQHGSKAVERHNIMVGQPTQFQGCERDIIYVSTVYGEDYVYSEIDASRKQLWNVTNTRSKGKVTLIHSYDIRHIKNKDDFKREIFSHFDKAPTAPMSDERGTKDTRSLRTLLEEKVMSSLQNRGYECKRMGGNVWSLALCIRRQDDTSDDCALVCIENHSDCHDAWERWPTISDQQMGLERAGTPCLRVDFLSLALRFELVLDDMLLFLSKAGLPERSLLQSSQAKAALGDLLAVSDLSDPDSASVSLPKNPRKHASSTGSIQSAGTRKRCTNGSALAPTSRVTKKSRSSARLAIEDDSDDGE